MTSEPGSRRSLPSLAEPLGCHARRRFLLLWPVGRHLPLRPVPVPPPSSQCPNIFHESWRVRHGTRTAGSILACRSGGRFHRQGRSGTRCSRNSRRRPRRSFRTSSLSVRQVGITARPTFTSQCCRSSSTQGPYLACSSCVPFESALIAPFHTNTAAQKLRAVKTNLHRTTLHQIHPNVKYGLKYIHRWGGAPFNLGNQKGTL